VLHPPYPLSAGARPQVAQVTAPSADGRIAVRPIREQDAVVTVDLPASELALWFQPSPPISIDVDGVLASMRAETEYLVDAITGRSLPAREHDLYISTSRSEGGLTPKALADVGTIHQLAPVLARAYSVGIDGWPSPAILLCARAGSGKTWSVHQLVHALCDEPVDGGEPVVPLLITVQRLATRMRDKPELAQRAHDVWMLLEDYADDLL